MVHFDIPLNQISLTKNGIFNKGLIETYRSQLDDLLQFHQVKRSFNHFDKFFI